MSRFLNTKVACFIAHIKVRVKELATKRCVSNNRIIILAKWVNEFQQRYQGQSLNLGQSTTNIVFRTADRFSPSKTAFAQQVQARRGSGVDKRMQILRYITMTAPQSQRSEGTSICLFDQVESSQR